MMLAPFLDTSGWLKVDSRKSHNEVGGGCEDAVAARNGVKSFLNIEATSFIYGRSVYQRSFFLFTEYTLKERKEMIEKIEKIEKKIK